MPHPWTLEEFIWDLCGRHWGRVADRAFLVLFYAEEPRLAVLDTWPFEHFWAPMPQQIPMSEQSWTCRTVRTPWAPVGLGVIGTGMLKIQLVFTSWPPLLGGVSPLLVPTSLCSRSTHTAELDIYPMEQLGNLQNEQEVTQMGLWCEALGC